jgi:hypothetical protein
MTTSWKIENIKRIPSNGLVIEVTYVITFNNQKLESREIGICKLTGSPQDPNFIPFEQLTEEIVINWVKNDLGPEKINSMISKNEVRLQEMINKLNNPEFLIGLPWK